MLLFHVRYHFYFSKPNHQYRIHSVLMVVGTVIEYKAKYFTDAWKIEQVTLTLHFKDANGLLPSHRGVKPLPSTCLPILLDGFAKHYRCVKTMQISTRLQIKPSINYRLIKAAQNFIYPKAFYKAFYCLALMGENKIFILLECCVICWYHFYQT